MTTIITTKAMIEATVNEFSFMFTDIPPRSYTAKDSPTVNHNKYYHPHRDFIIKVNEKLEAWNGRTYPLSPPTSNELSPSSSTRRPNTIDRSNPYDLYGPPTAESVTPTHTLFLDEDDQDRSATSSSPATSTSESGTPATAKLQDIELETPHIDRVPSVAPPAYRENPYYTNNMHHSKPCYIPFEYAQLPHFHPPRFSRRLRSLIAERRRPMQLSLLPLHQPRPDEKKQWIIESPDSTLLPTPKNNVLQRWDNFLQWWDSFDPRFVVCVSLITVILGIFIIALALTGFWG